MTKQVVTLVTEFVTLVTEFVTENYENITIYPAFFVTTSRLSQRLSQGCHSPKPRFSGALSDFVTSVTTFSLHELITIII